MSEPLKAVKAEAAAPPEGVLVPLVTDDGEVEILVPPAGRWFEGAVEALMQNRFSAWAELALDGDNFAAWSATRKRYEQIDRFFGEWRARSGEDPKRSAPSSGSSRSTAKR